MLMPKVLAYLAEQGEKLKILWNLKTWKEWKILVTAIMECIRVTQKELDTSISQQQQGWVGIRKHGFDGSMIFFTSTLGPGNINRN